MTSPTLIIPPSTKNPNIPLAIKKRVKFIGDITARFYEEAKAATGLDFDSYMELPQYYRDKLWDESCKKANEIAKDYPLSSFM